MIFWLCLIFGVVFAWLGIKQGLYVLVATLFNILVGIYVAVLSTPVILMMSPDYSDSGYYAAATMGVLAVTVFIVLEVFAYFYLLRDAERYFPKLVDELGGAMCGFLCGYFLLGFIFCLICVMPFSRSNIPSYLPQRDPMLQFGSNAILRVCHFVGAYSLEYFDGEPEAIVEKLTTTLK